MFYEVFFLICLFAFVLVLFIKGIIRREGKRIKFELRRSRELGIDFMEFSRGRSLYVERRAGVIFFRIEVAIRCRFGRGCCCFGGFERINIGFNDVSRERLFLG